MKKSHRKDVILARIIFAAFCLLLVAAIFGAVVLVRHHAASELPDTQMTQMSESGQTGTLAPDTQSTLPTEATQEVEVNPIMQTSADVNLRAEPNTNCEVITILAAGTQLELIGEENGWAFVDYQGQTGYVSMEFLTELVPEESETQTDGN